ncbi:MAG: gliding motility-associated C-terminal domain-containing protein [Flavipsychrobacter sp.]|nr:gliding motility-associated C-terminal domain-containing protein [Flavipsychrobacter sp.]
MRSCFRLLFVVLSLFAGVRASAQLVGTDCFLQGRYVEVGINQMGGFGTCTSPMTYHPHVCCGTATAFTPGGNLDAVYDWGHDGWSVGSPQLMGVYSIPGFPQEGWSIQVGATEYRNGAWGGICTGAFAIPGGHTGYSNTGGTIKGFWNGNVAGLNIRMETRIDTEASWVVITAVIRNTTAAPIANIYYQRTLDPDNTSFWSGTPVTRNRIVHQNEDARHRVMVSANGETGASGTTPAYNATNSYLALATKDCRARACVISGLSPSTTPSTLWTAIPSAPSGSVTLGATVGQNNYADQGISLIYNLGTLAAFDSTIISYAYIYNGPGGIDSAFPDPQIVINGVPKTSYAPPIPNYDTFQACNSGLASIPVDFKFAEDKTWSWSKWTWSPGTGLASTTGAHNTINLTALPASITYTITGTDSATGMFSCHNKVFYLTILTCNGAEANTPCVGDTLWLNAPGDSLGATYKWYGPAPSTTIIGTNQKIFKFPAAIADTGKYTVVKTTPSAADTSTVDVKVIQLPALSLTSNQPNCGTIVNTLNLSCTPDSICTSFAWSGPGGYTSTLQNPIISPFDSSMEGVYTVNVVSDKGCKNTATVLVKPGPFVDFSMVAMPGCPQDSAQMVPFGAKNVALYQWNFGDTKTGIDPYELHLFNATVPGLKVHTVTLTVKSANGCTYSTTRTVDLRHTVSAVYSTTSSPLNIADTVCLGNAISFTDASTATKFGASNLPLTAYEWKFGDGSTASGPAVSHSYLDASVYSATLTVTDNIGCSDSVWHNMVVLQPVISAMSDTTVCLVQPMWLPNTVSLLPEDLTFPGYGYTYVWSPATGLSSATVQQPNFLDIGVHTYTLEATLNRHGCKATHVTNINSVLPSQIHHMSIDTKIMYGNSVQLYCDSEFVYTWTPNDGSLNNPNINNPIATPSVTTTYTVYGMDKYGCRDTAQVTIFVDSSATEHVPTGFTPNGDGLNDVFRFNGGKHQKLVEMRIFDRWGTEVFYSNSREVGWDGTYKGVPADMGVYFYTVILARPGHADNQVYKGEITLIR